MYRSLRITARGCSRGVGGGICFSPYSLYLATVVRRYLSLAIVLVREDVEVHLHVSLTKTEHFWQFVCG